MKLCPATLQGLIAERDYVLHIAAVNFMMKLCPATLQEQISHYNCPPQDYGRHLPIFESRLIRLIILFNGETSDLTDIYSPFSLEESIFAYQFGLIRIDSSSPNDGQRQEIGLDNEYKDLHSAFCI